MKKTYDYIHRYRGYWSQGWQVPCPDLSDGHDPVVIRSQLPDNEDTSVTNMAEYLEEHRDCCAPALF